MSIRLNDDPGAFGGLPGECAFSESRFAVLPVPYDGTATWLKGAAAGPAAILSASANMELYDIETGSEPWRHGIVTLAPLEGFRSPEGMVAEVRATAEALIDADRTVVGLGGEHSVSIGLIQAHAGRYRGLNILQLDAHADSRDAYEGSRFNHACVMARAAEICPCVQVGIRSLDVSETGNLDPDRVFYAHTYDGSPAEIAAVVEALDGPVYVTIDLDVLDPAEMPSTGTPEPGGLGYRQIVRLLAAVCARRTVVGFDVVELMPNPHNRAPDFLAARLTYQMMAFLASGNRGDS
jgi:N1-aminopropylagmatine ureohydrolase